MFNTRNTLMRVHFTHRKRKNPDGSYTYSLRRVADGVEKSTALFRAHLNTKRLRARAARRLKQELAKARNEWAYNPHVANSLYLHEAAELFIDYCHGKGAQSPPMSYRQAQAHERIVRDFVKTLPKTTLNTVKRGAFNGYFDTLVSKHKRRTVSQYLCFLQAFFRYAYNAEWMSRPIDCFTKEQHKSLHVLIPERFISDESLAQAFALDGYGLLCRTLCETGMRITEAEELTVASFSTVDLTIRIEATQEERTKRHSRVIPISEGLAQELSAHAYGKMHYEALFLMSQTTLRARLKPFGLSPHSFRKWLNTAYIAAGAPDALRKKVMGHTLGPRDGAYLVNYDPEQAVPYANKVHEKINTIRKAHNDS